MHRIFLPTLAVVVFALPASSALAADPAGARADWNPSLRLDVFGGGHFFDGGTNLGVASAPEASAGAKSNAMAGLRAAIALSRWAAAEVELLGMITPDRTYQRRADILGYRLNAVAYLLPGNLRPFALVGAGVIEVAATHADGKAGLVRDRDGEFHVGAGLDYRLLDHLSVRGDGRVVQMPGKRPWSFASDFEATLGVAFVFGAGPRAVASAESPPVAPLPPVPDKAKPPVGVGMTAPVPAAPTPAAPVPVTSAPAAPPPAPAAKAVKVEPPVASILAQPAPPASPPPAVAAPAPANVSTVKELLGRAKELKFEGSSSKLSLVSLPLIGQLAEALVKETSIQLEIVAHTAGSGDAAKDMALSKRRAGAVKNALIERAVGAGRLTATGRGSADPLAPNITRSGRKLNERMELHLLGADKSSR
jgi:outer membrane protein OmpA-like peptidoglycan-associated protein/opacity protein-like surface antigen